MHAIPIGKNPWKIAPPNLSFCWNNCSFPYALGDSRHRSSSGCTWKSSAVVFSTQFSSHANWANLHPFCPPIFWWFFVYSHSCMSSCYHSFCLLPSCYHVHYIFADFCSIHHTYFGPVDPSRHHGAEPVWASSHSQGLTIHSASSTRQS